MIEIQTQMRVGSQLMPLAYAYDNKNTARKKLKSLTDARQFHAVRVVKIAQKELTLIYTLSV